MKVVLMLAQPRFSIALFAFVNICGCSNALSKIDPGGGNSASVTVTVREKSEVIGTTTDVKSTAGIASQMPGELVGVISFNGEIPLLPAKVLKNGSTIDPTVCAKDAAIVDESFIVGREGKGIKNVFVYIDKSPIKAGTTLPAGGAVDQKGCSFFPHATVLPIGAFQFKNSDLVTHNVQTFSEANGSINVNVEKDSLYAGVFKKPEKQPFKSSCSVHPWMSFYSLVIDHPFAAVTDDSGSFKVGGLPSGSYKFRIWHERAAKVIENVSVVIESGKTVEIKRDYGPEKFGF